MYIDQAYAGLQVFSSPPCQGRLSVAEDSFRDTGTIIRNTDKQLVNFLDDGCNRNRRDRVRRLTAMLDRILSEGLKGKSRNQHWLRIFLSSDHRRAGLRNGFSEGSDKRNKKALPLKEFLYPYSRCPGENGTGPRYRMASWIPAFYEQADGDSVFQRIIQKMRLYLAAQGVILRPLCRYRASSPLFINSELRSITFFDCWSSMY